MKALIIFRQDDETRHFLFKVEDDEGSFNLIPFLGHLILSQGEVTPHLRLYDLRALVNSHFSCFPLSFGY
jgi:hypothetical protein